MPIYEYQALIPEQSCQRCRHGFEIYQQINEKPLSTCLYCSNPVRKIISWCRSAVMEKSDAHNRAKERIKSYEAAGMWSHAAELADKHSEKVRDENLRIRAIENYEKAGYPADALAKHEKFNDK